jgi:4-hydroxythreonine-4-phosphate dehydrogenase
MLWHYAAAAPAITSAPACAEDVMLALTMGDPAGIGGEITVKTWHALRDSGPAFLLIADPDWLRQQPGGADLPMSILSENADPAAVFAEALPVSALSLARPANPGRPDPANAGAVTASIARAVSLALQGSVDGVVTNPISKAVLQEAGFPYPGHTEYLGALVATPGAEVMMLAGPSLRVVPVTVHVSLRQALDQLDTASIVRVARKRAAAGHRRP